MLKASRLTFVSICLSSLAIPALADCPTSADLQAGVRVTETDDTVHDFRALADGQVLETIRFAGESDSVGNLLMHGIYVAALDITQNGLPSPNNALMFEYDPPAETLPKPFAGLDQKLTTVVRDNMSGDTWAETQTQVWQADSPLKIGDCTYERVTGVVTYTSDETHLEEIAWLPDLGLGLLMRYADSSSDDRFEMRAIEALK